MRPRRETRPPFGGYDVGRVANPSAKSVALNPLVQDAFAKNPPKSLAEVAKRYGELFQRVAVVAGRAADRPADAGRSPGINPLRMRQ